MRKIDCAHSWSVKMLPWSWFREIDVCIEAKIGKFSNFSLKIIFLGVVSCREWLRAFPKLENASLTLIQRNKCMLDFRFNIHSYFAEGSQRSIFKMRECAQSIRRMKLPPEIWFRGQFSLQYTQLFPWHTTISLSRKHLHDSGRRAIDFSHNFIPNRVIFTKKFFFSQMIAKCTPFKRCR
jgi:hypothetical protein